MPAELPQVLLVDDERRTLELLVRTLRKQARVETALSGDEAWEIFQRGEFSLVISDQRMPGMSGVDLFGRIAEVDDSVGRILFTGYADLEATVSAINRGRVHAYLHKPCSPPDLQATVKGVLDRVTLARENARLLAALAGRNEELDSARCSLDRAQARVLAAERLAVVGGRIAALVDDLRKPLTAIEGLGGELSALATRRGDPELESLSGALVDEVSGLARVCQELLDETGPSESARGRGVETLDDLVAGALSVLLEPAAAKGVLVDLALDSGIALEVDAPALERALRRLVDESLDAMPDGGRLRIETTQEADAAVIRISDTRPETPARIGEDLVEPGVTPGTSHGTGLGLAIVAKVMDDHEGALEVVEPPGGGAAFTLRLPLRHGA